MVLRDAALLLAVVLVLSLTLWPSWTRARYSTNTSRAIGDTRILISANQNYASVNCGLYAETLLCMTRDGNGKICIPGYPEAAPDFLGIDIAQETPYSKAGYWRDYQGFDVPDVIPAQCAPRSPKAFCYASWPTKLGVTGSRSFVGTSEGRLYEDPVGDDPHCVQRSIPTARSPDEPAWSPPPNVYDIEDPQLRRVHRNRALKKWLWELQPIFWPTLVVLATLTALVSGPRAVLRRFLLLIVIAGVLSVGIWFVFLSYFFWRA